MASKEAERIRATLLAGRGEPFPPLAEFRRLMLEAAGNGALPADVDVTTVDCFGVPAESIGVRGERPLSDILFLHGGAFVAGGCATHRKFGAQLAVAAHARVLLPDYRLAPENPFPAQIDDALLAYRYLLHGGSQPSNLMIAGDSAGGGLALGLILSLIQARDIPLPKALILLSPWTDLTLSGETYRTRAHLDPVDRVPALRRFADDYAPGELRRNPLVSPLFADLRNHPRMMIQVGEHETMFDDSRNLAERARAAGVSVTLNVWPEMWHGWQLAAPELPEANAAVEQIASYVAECLGSR